MLKNLEYAIGKLRLAPGDVLVIRADARLTEEQTARLKGQARQIVGQDAKIMVLGGGVDLSILTRAEIEARKA